MIRCYILFITSVDFNFLFKQPFISTFSKSTTKIENVEPKNQILYILIRIKYIFVLIFNMSNFIKLTSMIINISRVSAIEIHASKYLIHVTDDKFDGFWLFTSGYLHSNKDKHIEVCKEQHPVDYKNLTEWINKIN